MSQQKTYQQGKIDMAKEFVVMLQMAYEELDCHPDVLKTGTELRDKAISENLPEVITAKDFIGMEKPDLVLGNIRSALRIYENNIEATNRWDSLAWRLADALLEVSKRCPKGTSGIDEFTGMGAKLCVRQ